MRPQGKWYYHSTDDTKIGLKLDRSCQTVKRSPHKKAHDKDTHGCPC